MLPFFIFLQLSCKTQLLESYYYRLVLINSGTFWQFSKFACGEMCGYQYILTEKNGLFHLFHSDFRMTLKIWKLALRLYLFRSLHMYYDIVLNQLPCWQSGNNFLGGYENIFIVHGRQIYSSFVLLQRKLNHISKIRKQTGLKLYFQLPPLLKCTF